MNLKRNLRLGVAISLFLSSISNAKTVADWKFTETNTGSQTICTIETSDIEYTDSGPKVSTYLRISKAKNSPNSPVEMTIELVDSSNNSKGYIASGGASIALADIKGNKRSFWAINKNLSSYIQSLGGGSKIKSVGGRYNPEIRMSGSGFSDIISHILNECNGGQSLTLPAFEQDFFAQVGDINPANLDSGKTNSLRAAYFAAYKLFADIAEVQAQLDQLLSRYRTYIDELKANRDSANLVQNVQLPKAQTDLKNAQTKQAEARAALAKIAAQIPGLEAKIAKSQDVLNKAQAILNPLIPEYTRLTTDLSNAQSLLDASESRLSYIDARLRDGAAQLNALISESRSLESNLDSKRRNRDHAQMVYQDAQSRRANYNMSWERDSILRNHPEYSRLSRDYQMTSQQLRQTQGDTQRLRNERERVVRELHMCRTSPIITPESENQAENMQIAQLRPGNPGNPGGGIRPRPEPFPGGPGQPQPQPPRPPQPPTQPNPPAPQPPRPPAPPQPPAPPVRDCSHLERALQVANSQVAQSEQNERIVAGRLNDITFRMHDIERRVDFEVRRVYDSLVANEDQARRNLENIDREIRNDETRISQINNVEIPSLQRELGDLNVERPSVVARIDQSRKDVSKLTAALDSFKRKNDWDRKATAVETAQRQLESDQANLDVVLSQQRLEQQKLDTNIELARQAQDQINSLTAQLTALNKRAAELNEILKNLPAERAPFDEKIASLNASYNQQKTTFVNLTK